MSTSQEQELRLQQEILAEANKKAERIIARAHADCQNAVKQADTENAKRRDAALAEAQANADRRSRSIVRGIWMECRRRWLEERERRMNQCFDEVLGNAVAIPAADPRRANSLAALAKEAIAGLQGGELTAFINPADAILVTPQWLEEQRRAAGATAATFTVQADSTIRGGIRIATADHRCSYDNTYDGRLARLKERFRRQIAELGGNLEEE